GPVDKFHALAGGLHDTAVAIGQSGNRSGIQLALTPEGSRVLLGVPPAELSRIVVDLGDVLGPDARPLPARLPAEGAEAFGRPRVVPGPGGADPCHRAAAGGRLGLATAVRDRRWRRRP